MIALDQANDADALMAVRSDLAAKGYFGKKPAQPRKAQQRTAQPAIRSVLFNGWEILVGRARQAMIILR